jgi:dimethylhistidine N-methyltransferase
MQRTTARIDTAFRATPRLIDREVSIVDRRQVDAALERAALVAGLLAEPATIAPKYFYDAVGCELFCKICNQAEYYPTRTEAAIFDRERRSIAAAIGTGKQLVDLGAGDCAKAAAWLRWLRPPVYVAVDIAADALDHALPAIARENPDLEVRGVLTDFTRGLDIASDIDDGPTTFFYPGSSIGNFSQSAALEFLREINRHCSLDAGSGLLIGVDTKKAPGRLRAAYDDAAGVTAAFNRNILQNVNSILGTHFRPDRFAHVALYNETASRIEMYLEAIEAQPVTIDGTERIFCPGERIHTEHSYKYSPAEFTGVLERAGFSGICLWQDAAGDFAVYYASNAATG